MTDEGGVGQSARDFWIEAKLKMKLLTADGVSSLNYRWRSVNGTVYLLGQARSQAELDQVIRLVRETDSVRGTVSHVSVAS